MQIFENFEFVAAGGGNKPGVSNFVHVCGMWSLAIGQNFGTVAPKLNEPGGFPFSEKGLNFDEAQILILPNDFSIFLIKPVKYPLIQHIKNKSKIRRDVFFYRQKSAIFVFFRRQTNFGGGPRGIF